MNAKEKIFNIEEFLKFEKNNELLKKEISNVCFWQLIRFGLFQEIITSKYSLGVSQDSLANKSKIKRILFKAKQFKYAFPIGLFSKKKIDVLILNHPRRVMNNGKYECLYTDEIIKSLDKRYLVIEDPYLRNHLKPIPETNIIYSDFITYLSTIYRFINRIFRINIISKEERSYLINLFSTINNEFGDVIKKSIWLRKVEDIIQIYKVNRLVYKMIILLIKPKVILEVKSYGISRFAVNEIAKNIGVPTIELQHGIMGFQHVAYNYLNENNLITFPDYLFVFGEYWKENARLPISKSKIRVVGWPYFEKQVAQNKRQSDHNIITILFISGGEIGKDLSLIANKLSKLIDFKTCKIIYKLHPGEYLRWREAYPWLVNNQQIDVIDNYEHDMHYYISKSTIQVGVNSTSIFEGLAYGLKTAIVNLYGYERMSDLYLKGYAKLIENVDQLYEYIIDEDDNKNYLNQEYFWTNDSINKIKQNLEQILMNRKNNL